MPSPNPINVISIRAILIEAVDHWADKHNVKEPFAIEVVSAMANACAEIIKKCPDADVRAELALGAAQVIVKAGQSPILMPPAHGLVGHA